MRLRPVSVLLLAVLVVAASPPNKLNAQTTTSGGLTGVVTDPSHAVVPDTRIEIKNDAQGTHPINENRSRRSVPVLLSGA